MLHQLDRFIPNRSAMDFDYAHFALTEGRNGKDQEETAVSSPSREAYRKQLAETMNLNHTRILAFRNKPKDPAQLLPTDHSASSLHQQQLVRIYFLLYCIDPFVLILCCNDRLLRGHWMHLTLWMTSTSTCFIRVVLMFWL